MTWIPSLNASHPLRSRDSASVQWTSYSRAEKCLSSSGTARGTLTLPILSSTSFFPFEDDHQQKARNESTTNKHGTLDLLGVRNEIKYPMFPKASMSEKPSQPMCTTWKQWYRAKHRQQFQDLAFWGTTMQAWAREIYQCTTRGRRNMSGEHIKWARGDRQSQLMLLKDTMLR